MKRFVAEMQKAADAADMPLLFFQLVLIFGKATRKTMQALVLAALLESFVGTNDVILSARHYQHQCH